METVRIGCVEGTEECGCRSEAVALRMGVENEFACGCRWDGGRAAVGSHGGAMAGGNLQWR